MVLSGSCCDGGYLQDSFIFLKGSIGKSANSPNIDWIIEQQVCFPGTGRMRGGEAYVGMVRKVGCML